jgi:hypothetical protein
VPAIAVSPAEPVSSPKQILSPIKSVNVTWVKISDPGGIVPPLRSNPKILEEVVFTIAKYALAVPPEAPVIVTPGNSN